MLKEIAKFITKYALVFILFGALTTLGIVTTAILTSKWLHLTEFFTIVRHFADTFDFMWDTTTMFTLIGYSFTILVAYWTYKGILILVRLFRVK